MGAHRVSARETNWRNAHFAELARLFSTERSGGCVDATRRDRTKTQAGLAIQLRMLESRI
jgi:hypothetical protein